MVLVLVWKCILSVYFPCQFLLCNIKIPFSFFFCGRNYAMPWKLITCEQNAIFLVLKPCIYFWQLSLYTFEANLNTFSILDTYFGKKAWRTSFFWKSISAIYLSWKPLFVKLHRGLPRTTIIFTFLLTKYFHLCPFKGHLSRKTFSA